MIISFIFSLLLCKTEVLIPHKEQPRVTKSVEEDFALIFGLTLEGTFSFQFVFFSLMEMLFSCVSHRQDMHPDNFYS